MAKINKKRNTAFLYEVLVRELTRALLDKDKKSYSAVLSIIKEHFSNDSLLKKELDFYHSLIKESNLSTETAKRLLQEVYKTYSSFMKNNDKEVEQERQNLIKKTQNEYSKKIFNYFVPNYRDLATLYQIFNSGKINLPAKQKIILEDRVVERLSQKLEEQNKENLKPIDNLTMKTFIKKFNETYNKSLLKEQKELLLKYVFSFADGGVEFKTFLNEELELIKIGLQTLHETIEDKEIKEKFSNVLKKVDNFNKSAITENSIRSILKIQQLIHEAGKKEE